MSTEPGEIAFSQPKLPAISDSINLVSQAAGKNFEEQWNGSDKARSVLLRPKNSGEFQDDDVLLLLQQVSRSFITALQQNTKPYWNHLCEVLQVIKPYVHFLRGAPQISHYVERTYQKLGLCDHEDDELSKVTQTISSVFPDEVARLQEFAKHSKAKFPAGSSEESVFTVKGRRSPLQKGVRIPRGEALFPGGATYILDRSDGEMKHFAPRSLCLEDLKRCLPGVVREIAIREATLGGSLGTTALALGIDLPQTHVPTPPVTPRRSPSLPVIRTSVSDAEKSVQDGEVKKEITAKTGREVVEDFVKGNFLGKLKFAFLNLAPSLRYDPYSLVEVPESEVNPEHYVISSHCVLHVNPNGPAESQSLAEWHREACLFKAISNIGFFKNFLLTKMFRKWKEIKKFSQFLKVEAEIEKSLIPNTPSFGSALLRISGLLQDLARVIFLPFELNSSYSMEEFESAVFKTWETGNGYLEKFFNYCQLIVDKMQESCFEYLEYCEAQVRNHRHNYQESLAVGKRKRTIRLTNLKLAQDEVKRLGVFVRLVDHIIVSNLLALAQVNISRFVDETMPGPRPERDGLFSANMVFDNDHKLTLYPSSKSFAYSISVALGGVLGACGNLSHAMELGGKAEMFQEKNEDVDEVQEESKDQEANGVQHNFDKKRIPKSEVESLLFSGRDSTGYLPREETETFPSSTMTEQYEKQADSSESPLGAITRTDSEIQEDLTALNSELTSARKITRQATQQLCFRREHEGELIVEGQQFRNFNLHRSPLTKEKLMETLHNNEQITEALKRQAELLSEDADEVQQFCDDHSWLAEIHAFVSQWDDECIDSWRGQPTNKIEQQLNQIKAWQQNVLSMTKGFCTRNGLFFVECRNIQVLLLPRLNSTFTQLMQMVATDVLRLSHEVTSDVDTLSQLIKEQKADIKGFADFMQKLASVKEHVPSLMEKVEYIKNLYEVIRSCFRQLSPEEEMTEEKVWATWEAFLFGLQEASDFVEINKPLVAEKLLETITTLEQNGEDIGHTATSGQFLDPNENPTSVLQAMRELKDAFVTIRNRLIDLSKCQDVIMGTPYDLKHINDILHAIDKRQELWKYCDVSSHTMREWLKTIFRKMNVKKAMDKLTEWNNAGEKLKNHIPSDDEVLLSWLSQLEEFSQDLPFLLQLSSDALKPRHWRALFIGMGQDYDPSWEFTVAELLSFNLGRYKDLIATVCAGAAAEYALEIQLDQLVRGWQERDYKLAKHIPLMRPRMGTEQRKSAKGSKKTRHAGAERGNVKVKPKTPASVPDLFILIGAGELKCVIEDNLVTLNIMLSSPHVADLKPLVETWITDLQVIENVTDVWADCQKKWLYLSNVFAEPQLRKSFADSIPKFTDIDNKYREFIQVILKEPKVLAVLSKKRGDKGWRELQGESLRALLLDLIRKEEELIRLVDEYIEQARIAFPRLFFLSDNDLLGLLAWSRNPKDLLPFVRKCFPSIKNLQFALPRDPSLRMASSLDTALNAHLLQVTAIEGVLEEVVPLTSVIPASPRPQSWLVTLEKTMRDTLVQSLAQCVERRLGGRESATRLLGQMISSGPQVPTNEATNPNITRKISKNQPAGPLFDHILLKYPSQCVITAEAVLWSKTLTEALQSGKVKSLSHLRTSLGSYVNDLSLATRKNMELKDSVAVHGRLDLLLGALVAMAINQRDIVMDFIKNGIFDVNSFEWQSQLTHQIELREMLSSTYQGDNKSSSSTIPIDQSYQVGLCSVHQIGNSFVYGYEYLGPTSRLVVTPLTQRCFMTLTLALMSHQCGVPVGPDGMGKTETIKDLSKALGRHLVMFNCSEQLTNPMLVRYLFGMIKAGSWACFENVDCVNPGVLSIFGEHLSTIRMSLKCLEKIVNSQYSARGFAKTEMEPAALIKRRNSVTTLSSLPNEAFTSRPDPTTESDRAERKRQFSMLEASNDLESDDYVLQEQASPSPLRTSTLPRTFQDKTAKLHANQDNIREFEMPILGNIVWEGQLVAASAMYGCFMTMSASSCTGITDLPENFRAQLRPVSMLFPDCLTVLEVWLLCSGFTEAKALSQKMNIFFKLISEQVSSQPQYSFGLRSMKMVTTLAGKQLQKDLEKRRPSTKGSVREETTSDLESDAAPEPKTRSPFLESLQRRQTEENAVVHSLFTSFGNKLLTEDRALFSRAVDEVFAHSVLMSVSSEGDSILVEQVKEHLQVNGLQVRQEIIIKILQLYTSLQTSRNVILLGCPGSGKSTIYQTLSSALNSLNNQTAQRVVKPRRQPVAERRISTSTRSPKVPVEEIKEVLWPRVDLSVVFPKSLTCQELFGVQDPDTNLWVDGLVSKWLRDSTLTCDTMAELLTSHTSEKQRIARMMGSLSHVKKWMVLDGPMDSTWLDNMGTLLDSTKALNLPNGESISQPDTVTLLFEVTDVAQVSPALVTRCGLIHCPENLVGWKSIFRSWSKGAHAKWDITNRGLGIISCLMDHTMDATLSFLSTNCQPALNQGCGFSTSISATARGVHEVHTLLHYLSAIFDRHILREDDDSQVQMISQKNRQSVSSVSSRQSSGISASDTGKVISTFAFAFVWAFGGHLHESCAVKFDEHARQLLSSGPYPVLVPPEGLVYDYFLDFAKGGLVKWEERPGIQLKTLASSYAVVPEVDRYSYLLDLMISSRQPVLLVGPPGVGKSSLVQNLINPRYNSTRLCLSPGFTAKLLQDAIEYKLQQIQQREKSQMAVQQSLGNVANRNLPNVKTRPQLMFLDDMNCAGADAFGVQPPLELLRQILSQGTLYDKRRYHFCRAQQLQFMAACVPPGARSSCGGVACHPVSPRLTRLMTVLSFFPLSTESLQGIYSSVFLAWLEEFPAYSLSHHEQLAKALSSATIKMYTAIHNEFRPTPVNPHFLFTQHELSRVVQGMTLFSSKTRGRPRPRARRVTEDRSKEGERNRLETTGSSLGTSKSEPYVAGKKQGLRESNITKGRSWPTLVGRDSGLSIKTPAVMCPMIRSLLRLWCHESTRTYSDRLLTEDQRFWFSSLLHESVEEFFCKDNSELGSEVFPVELADMQGNLLEIVPGTSAPPSTAVDEASYSKETTDGEDGDDSMVLPSSQQQVESGEESDLEEDSRESAADQYCDGSQQKDGSVDVDEPTERGDADTECLPDPEEEDLEEGREVELTMSSSKGGDEVGEEDIAVVDTSVATTTQPTRVKVTFDDRSGASYDKSYKGPLISSEQLAFSGEDLTDILFCKHFNASVTGRESSASEVASRNYLECGEGILEQGIKRCLASYNEQALSTAKSSIMNLVTFREALQHAARLSRALATPGGHALLLSSLGYGRRTLTRVVAHAACCKMIELQRSQFQSQDDLRQQMKAASFVTGLQGKQVLLFVPEGVSDESMQDICSLMAEGTCPGLYTANELSMISSQLLPGGKRGARRVENQTIAQERFFRRVKSHMHVVVCLKYTPISLTSNSPAETQLYRFPTLVTRSCCVDVYRAWPHEALVSVAEKLLEQQEDVLALLPLKRRDRDTQAAAICSIMAHVHLSARCMVERVYGVKALKLYSPDTFLDFVDLFRTICRRLCVKEKEEVAHLDKAIKRIDEATSSLNKMQRDLDQLTPVFEAAKVDVQQRHEAVEGMQKEYAAAKDRCKQQEQDIEDMQGPIELLKKQAQEEFEKVSPLFDAAWNAINSLDVYDVEEIRSYRTPPNLVTLVVNSICLLFEKEQNWEEGKLLLNRGNFFKDLEFYDMKNMPNTIFRRLRSFYDNPQFRPAVVKDGSVAAKSLCMWVRAVYEYCLVYRALEPKRLQLLKAEQELEKAKTLLGEMRVRCNAVKQELESNIQSYKDSMKHSRTVEKQIQSIEAQKAQGNQLVDSLSMYSSSWHTNRKIAKQRLITAPGDSLVTAAGVCYLGPLMPAARDELFMDWLRVCDGAPREPKQRAPSLASVILERSPFERSELDCLHPGRESRPSTQPTTLRSSVVPLRKDVSLEAILSSPDEVDEWRRNDLPSDEQALQNALILRSCSNDRSRTWPLLIDPHNQAGLWIRALHEDELANQRMSRAETRQSERTSSHMSGRLSIELEGPALDYADLEQSGADDLEAAEPQLSDNDDDQFLQYLDDNDDQESSYPESETPATSRTERTAGSTLTSVSERVLTERLAESMGIQIESPPQPGPVGPTPNVGLTEGEILIISADDPQIVNKLRAAVKKGLVTLVTHVERRRWHKSLELLLARHTFRNTDGTLQVTIGKFAVDYNPSFRLYLSSSQPLFMPGEGQYPLPFSKSCAIDVTVSRAGVRDMLLVNALRLERPEFDGQQRSVERDLSLHRQQIVHAKDFIRDKVLNLGGQLLKDTTLLKSVTQSKGVISMAEERCVEAEVMKTELLTKQSDYLPVAQHGALLFSVISELHKLHPYYRFPLKSFLHLYNNTVAERNRGKKSSGSPAARAAELITALSRKIYDRTSWSLFEGDNHVFPFLLAVEKMLNTGAVSLFEWQLFTRMSNHAHDEHPQGSAVEKPDWVAEKVWDSVADLEHLSAFSGLSQSVAEQPDQWQEYFNLPPVLLSATPGDFSHLTVFQKALLWKTFQQDQMFRVCQDLVLYQVGANMTQPVGYELHQVYSVTSCASPVIFILPSQKTLADGKASVLKDPVSDVINLARAHNKDDPLLRVTLGERVSMDKALTAVKRGMSTGCWVILENCHMATTWSEDFMHELEKIVSTPVMSSEDESENHLAETNSQAQLGNSEPEDVVHPDFRLWITTRADTGLHLPAVLIQCGLKLACDAQGSFREMVTTNCRVAVGSLGNCVPVWGKGEKHSVFKSDVPSYAIYTLALLHSVLLQRRKYCQSAFGCPYQWSQADLLAGLEALRPISRACHASLPPATLESVLGEVTYGGYATNGLDWNVIKSMVYLVSTNQVTLDSHKSELEHEDMNRFLNDSPEALSSQELGLTETCSSSYQAQLSSDIAERLRLSTGVVRSPVSLETHVKSIAKQTLNQLLNIRESIKPSELESETQTSTTSFFLRELSYFQVVLDKAIKDVELLLDACTGLVAFTPDLFSLASCLGCHRAHPQWGLRLADEDGIAAWLKSAAKRVKAVQDYLLPPPLQPSAFSLGAFVHPQAFLACVLMDHARSSMKSVYTLEFSTEVLHSTLPSSPADRGVFLSGLKLNGASWDADRGCVVKQHAARDFCELPIIWLKPMEIIRSRAPSAKPDIHDVDIPSYDCPLLTSGDWGGDITSLVTSLSLPSAMPEELLKQRRVSIVSVLS